MTTGIKPYASMKPSGIPWLGDIPAHWTLSRTKALLAERSEKGHPDKPLLAATQTKGVVRKKDYANRTVLALKDLHLLKFVEVGDFVISLRSFQGGIEYARDSGIISPAYTVLYAKDPRHHKFLACLFKSRCFVDSLVLAVTGIREGQNIDYGRLARSTLPLPPLPEQSAIARFLDHINRRIQKYIRAKEKLIALLDEYKQALIDQAVTGQIDVRTGEPYPEYKESGVNWLGRVPKDWDLRPAKWHLREVDERSKTGEEEMLSVSHITGVTPRKQKNVTMFKAESNVGHKLCKVGDIVVNTMWAWMTALGVAREEGLVSPSYAVYRPYGTALEGNYADLLLRSAPFKSEYICRSTGIRASRLRLYPENFLSIKLLCPSIEEQRAIVDFVDTKSAAMRHVADLTRSEISFLREYHRRLIADVVTGKLNVREAAAESSDTNIVAWEDGNDTIQAASHSYRPEHSIAEEANA